MIGDIHGHLDPLERLLGTLGYRSVDGVWRHPTRTVAFIGDLVDRGPDSASVIERAIRIGAPFDKVTLLIGNHEECFLSALSGDCPAA